MEPLDPELLSSAGTRPPHTLSTEQVEVLDLKDYLERGAGAEGLAQQLCDACADGGFFFVTHHGVPLDAVFDASRAFHALPPGAKVAIPLDDTGCGYLAINQAIMPVREKANLNAAFIMTSKQAGQAESTQWPAEAAAPGFRATLTGCDDAMGRTARALLPLFATALRLPADFFDVPFTTPRSSVRLSHYPSTAALRAQGVTPDADQLGLAPHADITFLTLAGATQPGTHVWYRGAWHLLPAMPGALLVFVGSMLQRWSNDTFHAPVHHVKIAGDVDRYSALFFYYPDPDYVVACLPGCSGPDRPAKYPPQSFTQSRGPLLLGFKRMGQAGSQEEA